MFNKNKKQKKVISIDMGKLRYKTVLYPAPSFCSIKKNRANVKLPKFKNQFLDIVQYLNYIMGGKIMDYKCQHLPMIQSVISVF